MIRIVPTVTVRCFPNNKLWVTRDIKVLLNEKKRAFRDGDREQMRRVQREVKERIQQGKDSYRRKLEHKLQQNNLKDVWSGMKSIAGYKPSGSQTIGGGIERANELNLFFNRFDLCCAVENILPGASSEVGASQLGRPQYVRLQDSVSSTGAPQGTVLSPSLFTLYTSEFQFRSDSRHLQKLADDSAIVGCVSEGKEEEYRCLVDSFVECCAHQLHQD